MRNIGGMAALAAGLAVGLAAGPAHAGGAIGWATAVTQFSTEGESVGAAAVVLAIMGIGVVLAMAMHSMLPAVVGLCLGGALMANAAQVATIFGGGGGGGSIRHVHGCCSNHAAPLVPGGPAHAR